MRKKKNLFLYLAVLLVLLISGYLYLEQTNSVSIGGLQSIFSLDDNNYNSHSEGSNNINVEGLLRVGGNDYSYYGTFIESYIILENLSGLSTEFAVQRYGSGVIGIEDSENPIVMKIDYEDKLVDERYNNRYYLLEIETIDGVTIVEEEYRLRKPDVRPIDGLNLSKIFKEYDIIQ